MNMKKRSQSSLRSKTLHSEADQNQNSYWIGSLPPKKQKQPNIASSMIEQSNKQNTEYNMYNCQSVQELSNRSEIVNRTPTTYKSIHAGRKESSAMQVTPIDKVKGDVNEAVHGSGQGGANWGKDGNGVSGFGPFNYVEQYYQVQIQALNSKITQMSSQLKKYRSLYCSKQSQLSDLNQDLSSRITKQNLQKNVLIKQINSNNIQIKRLKQEVHLHKSQKQCLKLMLAQKETTIQELKSSIVQVEVKKKKIQAYQIQLHSSQNVLQEIEIQANKLRAEAVVKDQTIKNNTKKITTLSQKLALYEQEIKELQRNMNNLKDNTYQVMGKVNEREKECQEWKNKYCAVVVQLEELNDLRGKVRQYQGNLDELQGRVKELVGANQKFKIQVAGLLMVRGRVVELEKELGSLKGILRNKCQQLQTLQSNSKLLQTQQEQLIYFQTRSSTLESQLSQTCQQLRLQKHKSSELSQFLSVVQEELASLQKQPHRIKQLQSKIDTLFSENQQLHATLLEKLAEIQELQRKGNVLESKNSHLGNELIKIRSMYDGLREEFSQLESKLENMKNRWETELGAKLGLEEKCNRVSKEVVQLRVQVGAAEDGNRRLLQKMQQICQQFCSKKQQLQSQLQQLNSYKSLAEEQLQISRTKLQNVSENLQQLREQIDEEHKKYIHCLTKIKQLQNTICTLQEELRVRKNREEIMYGYWVQVRDVSGAVLAGRGDGGRGDHGRRGKDGF